jgi:hypothetical protein
MPGPAHQNDPPIGPAVDNLHQKPKSSNQQPKLSLSVRPIIQTSPMTSVPFPIHRSAQYEQSGGMQNFLDPKSDKLQDSFRIPDEPKTSRPTKARVETKAEQQGRNKDLLRTQRVSILHLLIIFILISHCVY